ncbi:MAG: YeeE/YedE thiosulfate transporter family protein [Methylococcales bacterium]|nr:YeeE/YedE thiosulfate transporter family protein [Methylococcales bacterium]
MSFKKSSAFLIFTAFLSGLLFGLGLIVAQMTNPAKVLGFLDVLGDWDPSLAFVMAGALVTLSMTQFFIKRIAENNVETVVNLSPVKAKIDAKLIIGSAVFGIGWGLSGLCPGPALVSLTSGLMGSFIFVSSMLLGFIAFKFIHHSK